MRRLIKGLQKPGTFLPALFILILGFLAATQILSAGAISIITGAIAIVVWALIMIGYIPPLIYVLRAQHRVEEQNFFLGVIMLFSAIAAWNFWRIVFVVMNKPDWMVGNWFPSLLSIIASMSGFYFLSAPGVSRVGVRYTTIAIVGVIALAGIGFTFLDSL